MRTLEVRTRRVRHASAVACAIVTAGYLLTGTGAMTVTHDQPPGAVPPLLLAAALFGALGIVTLLAPRRWVWVMGAGLQVAVLLMYLAVAADREPAYEPWGLTLKALQVGLLATFGWLVSRARAPTPSATHPMRPAAS